MKLFQKPEKPDQAPKTSSISPCLRWGLLLFVVALGVRLLGIGWGLANGLHNQSLHPDEEVNWRYSQMIDPAHGEFTPGFYGYGTLYFTLLNMSSSMTAAYTGGPKPNTTDWDFISRCILSGRILSALFGAGLAVCVFAIVWRLTNPLGAWMAGGMAAFSPGLVVHSRFATVDMLAAFLIALTAWCAIQIVQKSDLSPKELLRISILGGLYAGLSCGTKYTGIIALLMIWTALLISYRKAFWKNAGFSLITAIGAFVISTPGCLLDSKRFLEGVTFEMAHTSAGHGLVFAGTTSGYIFQISNLILGVGFLAVAVGGFWLVFKGFKKQAWALVLLAFAVPTYLLIGKAAVKFYRYSIPLAIPIAVSIGMLAGEADQTKLKGKSAVTLAGCSVIGILGGGLRGTTSFTAAMMGQDPRDAAGQWLKSVSADNTSVGLPSDPWFWSPSVFPNTGLSRMVPFSVRNHFREEAKHPKVVQYIPDDPGQRLEWDPQLITKLSPDYIAFSDIESENYARLMSEGNPDHNVDVERYSAFMTLLTKGYTLDKIFGTGIEYVEDMQYVTPTVYVWKKKSSSQ